MNILSLKIENIASIEQAFIDFERGPLADDSLFLIAGDTGTGKTTILNAITLALYDEVPSLCQITATRKELAKLDNITVTDTRHMLRKGAGAGSATLRFTGNDGHTYEALWSVRRAHGKPTGNLQDVERSLRDLTNPANDVTGSKAVDKAIQSEAVVGLTFSQFTRTTMLAQGEFAAFMKATDKDKAEILEQITGTDIYAAIGDKINRLAARKKEECLCMEAEIKGANLLGDAEREAHSRAIAEQSEAAGRLGLELADMAKRLEWLTRHEELVRQIQAKEQTLATARATVESDGHCSARLTVKSWDDTAEVRSLQMRRAQAADTLAGLKHQMEQPASERLATLLQGVEYLRSRRTALAARAGQLAERVAHLEPLSRVLDNAQRFNTLAEAYSHESAAAQSQAHTIGALRHTVEELAAAEVRLRLAAEKARADLQTKTDEVERLDQQIQQADREGTTRQLTGLVERHTAVNNALAAVEAYRRALDGDTLAQQTLEAGRRALADTDSRLAELTAALPGARLESERAEAFLQGQMELNDHIASLRERFKEEHRCPLCGTEGVHLHTSATIDQALAAARSRAEAAAEALRRLTEAEAAKKAERQVQGANLANAQKAAERSAADLQKATAAAAALATDYASPDCLPRLDAEKQQLDDLQTPLKARLQQIEEMLTLLKKARNAERQSRQGAEAAERALAEGSEATRNKRHALDTAKETERIARANAAKYLADAGALLACEEAAGNALLANMMAEKTGHPTLTAASIKEVADLLSAQSRALTIDRQTLADVSRQVEALGEQVAGCEAALQPLLERFGTPEAAAPRQVAGLNDEIRQFAAHVNTLDGQIAATTRALAELVAEIDRWYTASDYTPDDVKGLENLTPQAVADLRAGVTAAEQALQRALNERNVIASQMEEHLGKRPDLADDDTIAALSERRAAAEEARRAAEAETTRLKTILEQDALAAATQQQNLAKLARLRSEFDQWHELDSVFGTSEGARFRSIAQSYILRALLAKANYYLEMLSPRYRLDCLDGSLGINVVDRYLGQYMRNVGLLSGGESFVVSLALALGLSAINKKHIHIDTLFIDEGFGTLDSSVLDTVISTLDRLHTIGGRRIGIISHVEELKNSIPTQILLMPTSPSTSSVQVITR